MIGGKTIMPRQRRRMRDILCCVALVLVIYCLFLAGRVPKESQSDASFSTSPGSQAVAGHHSPELLNNLSLTVSQCEAAFPNLTWSIEDVVSQGPFTLTPKTAPVLGRIKSGQLHILKSQRRNELSAEMLNSRTASLHQIQRALLTAPPSEPVPDTVFALNFQDQPFGTAWAYSRQADPKSRPGFDDGNTNARTFLMPHFSFWAWRLPFIGSMGRAAEAIAQIETRLHPTFASKIPKAVWRGTTWFNSVHNPRLRANLLAAAKDKPWADVEALKWDGDGKGGGDRTASNSIPIEDFCKYRYILHTEGVTYSGRFQFLQLCASVVITPPIGWMQHATHLVRPVFSSTLLPGQAQEGKQWAAASPMTSRAWGQGYGAEEANIIFVKPDWSDLDDVITWLEAHPDVAEGIAGRQRGLFAGGGYFSPAAEACYWRALVRGWSEVVRVDAGELAEVGPGQTFESFVLTNGD
ncbi:hypothetical protein KVR01_001319 [Diaporthe batatas]|uniref:uncharacterized protein n=1 Tax=Diaporthe batatas TaxID=748121 RepID=UPI001D04D2C3|nr:uncharacterized protein KVR01_001319 [Diaporthe batatas]KAG8168570.1 hypothetical protein KVR01_001319 [Diaporthe batatas]